MDVVCEVDAVKSEADNSSWGKKTFRTSLGNIGHSIANIFGKVL